MERYGWWNLWLIAGPTVLTLPNELNSLTTAPQVKVPALFVLSGSDTLVPLEYQQMVINAYAGPKRTLLLPNAQHNTPITPTDQRRLDLELNWLWNKTIPPTAHH
jgi:uncharacterized protein